MKLRHMKLTSHQIVTVTLLLLLPLLAGLQYHWLGQLSASEREQMRFNLRSMAARFGYEFDQEITRTYGAFLPLREAWDKGPEAAYAASYDRWAESAPYPGLIESVLLARAGDAGQLELRRLNPRAKQFDLTPWPDELASLRAQLERVQAEFQRSLATGAPPPREEGRRPSMPQALDDEGHALVLPMLGRGKTDDGRGPGPPHLLGFVIVRLNLAYIQREVLPSLARRHFVNSDGLEYDLAVLSSRDHRPIYQSKAGHQAMAGTEFASRADASVSFFNLRADDLRGLMRKRFEMPSPGLRLGNSPHRRGPRPGLLAFPAMGFLQSTDQDALWQLEARHPAGSLEAAVAGARRRNLIISFSVLAMLAASVALMMLSARRARRLARQQMDFVAGISHELRTPLAVIDSAGYNMAKGVIRDSEQVKNYGALIRRETRLLGEMVEQVLEFAGVESEQQRYEPQALDLAQVIDDVLTSCRPLLAENGFRVEVEVAPDLPAVAADPLALRRALQNLLDNAMKYSADSRRIWIRAEAGGERRVQVAVSDQGIGIPTEELSQIFKPFCRGSEARAAQIRGNGLGLSLVKNIVEAHGGRISVASQPGKGSTFTLSLPAVARVEQPNRNYEQAHSIGRG